MVAHREKERRRERKREIRDNSRNIRDLVSSGAQQTPPAMLQKPFYISCTAVFSIRYNNAVVIHTSVRELCLARLVGTYRPVSSHVILAFRTCHRFYATSIRLARLRHLSTSKWNYTQHLISPREIKGNCNVLTRLCLRLTYRYLSSSSAEKARIV